LFGGIENQEFAQGRPEKTLIKGAHCLSLPYSLRRFVTK
jgi:hypothetical protein